VGGRLAKHQIFVILEMRYLQDWFSFILILGNSLALFCNFICGDMFKMF